MGPDLSVSVDLDEVESYHEIHGLEGAAGRRSRAVYTVAVPRLLDLFERLGVRATFFVVGSSLDPEVGAAAAAEIVLRGHEVANHTESHRYDLLALDEEGRGHEIALGADAIEAATGVAPRGFRAPGYNVDDALLATLSAMGYEYDASVFPCPPYFLAKAAIVGAMRVAGRRSRSRLGSPRVLAAPTEPYLVAGPFHRRAQRGLVELPVAVLPVVRVPFIGTSVVLAGARAARRMAASLARRRFVGFELHGIDLLDAEDEDLAPLAGFQRDLRVPLPRKVEALEAAVATLLDGGARPVTCEEAARRFRARRTSG